MANGNGLLWRTLYVLKCSVKAERATRFSSCDRLLMFCEYHDLTVCCGVFLLYVLETVQNFSLTAKYLRKKYFPKKVV